MHLCFVDESGTPSKPDLSGSHYFVIAGVIIPEEKWKDVSNRMQGLKRAEQYHGELKWRFFAPGNTQPENPMRDWPAERRSAFRRSIFGILTAAKSIKIVAGVAQAAAAYQLGNVNSQQDLYFGTYKVVTERFQYMLQDVSRFAGLETRGIIVADHRGRGDDDLMRAQHQRLISQTQNWTSTYGNLVEGLFLAPSHMSVGIQFADMVAGAIWRRFEHADDTYFSLMRPSIRVSNTGLMDGFGVCRFPKRQWTGVTIEG